MMINDKLDKSIIVCAPDYSESSGGALCLHHLANILVDLGYKTYIAPLISEVNILFFKKNFKSAFMHSVFLHILKQKKVIPSEWNKAVIISISEAKKMVKHGAYFIYTDTVLGNPYQSKKIIRWLLHYPMFFHKQICWSQGEVVVRFNSNIPTQVISDITFVDQYLKVVKYPIDLYLSKRSKKKSGSAYLIRKGKGKKNIHPENAICIDGLCHNEIAEILGKVNFFYSYDLYTAYSSLAAISGCTSIVVPDEKKTILEWYPSIKDRYGIAYGIENINWAIETRDLTLEKLKDEECQSIKSVESFFDFIDKLEF